MALLGEVSIPAAELYVMRFCVTLSRRRVVTSWRRFRPLLEFAELEWTPRSQGSVYVLTDRPPIGGLTSDHFNLIQANASGFGQLFVWFPPRTHPSSDEARLLLRAGVNLNFASHNIGVYNRGVSSYNG